jgi:streptogramin lyase
VRSFAGPCIVAAALIVTVPAMAAHAAADLDAAERQYRLALRLSADGSADAPAALEKVVALAPQGPLADDALIDLARLRGAPEWPEDLGRLTGATAASAKAPLEKVVAGHAGGDRINEARCRLALIRLAPTPERDAAAGRQDLLALAGSSPRDRWAVLARYALGVLDEQSGARDRAAGAFARIVVEQPASDVATRARAGLARTLLVAERFGEAAGWYQGALSAGVAATIGAAAQRDLAMREVVRARASAQRWTSIDASLSVMPTTRGASLLATSGDGRLVVVDRKAGVIQLFDDGGPGPKLGDAADVTAIATDPYGRVYAAAKDRLIRWDPRSGHSVSSSLGSFASPAAIAVDAAGVVFLADRKGDRVARWADGAAAPVVMRESKGAGVTSLVVFGGRLIAAEEKTGRLIALADGEAESEFGGTTFRRPTALAVDVAGRISVLDEKAETVTRLSPTGEVRETLRFGPAGISRAVALAAAPDGALRILDGSSGAVAVAR